MLKPIAPMRSLALAALLVVLAACGPVDYDGAPKGEFSGSLYVMWLNDGGPSGDGTFVYVPDIDRPLVFTRAGDGPDRRIEPEIMYTDGGSVPRFAQLFRGFNPWGYAPAYIIHDWLFLARHCNLDGKPTPQEKRFADMEFDDSAAVMAEAIKTLIASGRVKKNDTAPPTISAAVAGPIAEAAWNRRGACSRVSQTDRLAARAGTPGATESLAGRMRRTEDDRIVPLEAGRVVGVIGF